MAVFNNPLDVLQLWNPVEAFRATQGQDTIWGRMGHDWLGGADRQKNEQRQVRDEQRQDSMLNSLLPIAQQQQGWLGEDRARRNTMLDRLSTQANPYSQSSQGMQSLMALQQGSIRRNFAGAADATRRSLAQRGALGSAQETSALRQLALDQARALSGNEAQLRAGAYDQAQGFEAQRNSQLAGLLGMIGGGTGANIYGSLADSYGNRAAGYQNRVDRIDAQRADILANLLQTGMRAGTMYATGGMG